MNTATLSRTDLVNWITAMGAAEVDEATIDNEIDRYARTLERELGDGWTVTVSQNVVETQINGLAARAAEEELREALDDAEVYVGERFWF